jgi:thiol-disulfide isomerase/thioredoxin
MQSIRAKAVAALVAIGVLAATSGSAAVFRSVSVAEAARMVEREHGKPTLVMLYAAYCPHCRAIFSDFVDLADRYKPRGVAILAFATDDEAAETEEYVGSQRLPFARIHIEPWKDGELRRAFERIGFDIGDSFGVPLLAILDKNGDVVGQYGSSGLERIERRLDELLDG